MLTGTLAKWNDERGFGFIAPASGGSEVFVHISAFPRDGARPQVGERLWFDANVDANGRRRATSVTRPGSPPAAGGVVRAKRRRPGRRSSPGWIVPLLVMAALGAYGIDSWRRARPPAANLPAAAAAPKRLFEDKSTTFKCDGRLYCSQMTSCAEATYFLRNCPGVKMDGDRDGLPCEEQWCK